MSSISLRTSAVCDRAPPKFDLQTPFNSFRIYFPADDEGNVREFWVNPHYLAALSDHFASMCFVTGTQEVNNNGALLATDKPDDVLEVLQCSMLTKYSGCKAITVDNFCLLAHYADLWLMGGFIETLERFVEEKFTGIKTNLATTLQMLECACIARMQSQQVYALLVGRAAAFGADALLNANVLASLHYGADITGLLFLYAEKKWKCQKHLMGDNERCFGCQSLTFNSTASFTTENHAARGVCIQKADLHSFPKAETPIEVIFTVDADRVIVPVSRAV